MSETAALTLSLSESDVTRIADAVVLRLPPPAAQKIGVTVADLQVMLSCPSRWATQMEIKRLGLKPYCRGKYRLRDAENAIARRTRGQ